MDDAKIKDSIDRIKAAEQMVGVFADAIFARTLETNVIIYWSENASSLYGYNQKEAIGKVKFNLLQSGPQEVLQRASKELKEKGFWKGVLQHKNKNGETLYIESIWLIAKDLDETPLYILEFNSDITLQIIQKRIDIFTHEVTSSIKKIDKRPLVLQIAGELASKEYCDFSLIHHRLTGKYYSSVNSSEWHTVVEKLAKYLDSQNRLQSLYSLNNGVLLSDIDKITDVMPIIGNSLKRACKKLGISSLIIHPLKIFQNTNAVLIFGTLRLSDSPRLTGSHYQAAQDVCNDVATHNEQLLLKEQLEREKKRIEDIIDTIPGVVWEATGEPDSPEQTMSYVSKYAEDLLGYKVEEWLNNPNFWLHIVHDEDKQRAAEVASDYFHNKKKGKNVFRWLKKNGDHIWVEATSIVVMDENNKPIGMRGVVLDISQKVQKDEQKDVFISMASHELKTPIATLKVFAQLLEKKLQDKSGTTFQKYITKILRQVDHMTILINDLLNLSRIEQGRLVYHMERADVYKIVLTTVEELNTIYETHKINLLDNVKQPVVLMVDVEKIKQVITNVISNAVKYSPNAGKVDVIISKNKKQLKIDITDYGIGISQEDVDRVFEKYYRVNDEHGRTFSGLGVGLFISHEILTHHKGEIKVKSKIGKGSTFSVRLPLT